MDTKRFEELQHTIANGGLPSLMNETFTIEQAATINESITTCIEEMELYREAVKECTEKSDTDPETPETQHLDAE